MKKVKTGVLIKNLPVLGLGGIIAIGKLVGKKSKLEYFFDKNLPVLDLRGIILGDIQATANYLGKHFFLR